MGPRGRFPTECRRGGKMAARTMFEKIWDGHTVHEEPGAPSLIYIDLHLVHEVTSPQAFEGLRLAGRKVRRPDLTVATVDHNTPTWELSRPVVDPISKRQLDALAENVNGTGIAFYDRFSRNQGIVHVIGPDLGYTQPGMTVVCGDSHTSTHGALGCFCAGDRDVGGGARAGDANATSVQAQGRWKCGWRGRCRRGWRRRT